MFSFQCAATTKLLLLVGAGVVGSIVLREGSFSGAGKVIFEKLKQYKNHPASVKKPVSESVLDQFNSLSQDVLTLASNRQVTIVTRNGTSTKNIGITVIVVGAVGYGYIWWKGYKLHEMMFVTRQGLSDACNIIAKQLDALNSMIMATKKVLSDKIIGLESNLKEIRVISTTTQDEVSQLRDRLNQMNDNFHYVRHAVQTLESNINSLEEKQDQTLEGVAQLCYAAKSSENLRPRNRIETLPSFSSMLALEAPYLGGLLSSANVSLRTRNESYCVPLRMLYAEREDDYLGGFF